MAFDGTVIACIAAELNSEIQNGRIVKIAQPEKDALLLTIKKDGRQLRLLISVNASLPIIYLTETNLASPPVAPAFCMLLRKHLTNSRILSISQPSLERILRFELEHYNEMGDLCRKQLVVELMGKHSNLIFMEDSRIIDSIKHVSALVSSVREVLPGRDYFVPFEGEKEDPLSVTKEAFMNRVFASAQPAAKALYTNLTGFSPALAAELLYRADLDSDRSSLSFSQEEKETIWQTFLTLINTIRNHDYQPNIVYENGEPVFYAPFYYESYADRERKNFASISTLLYTYYAQKQQFTSIKQKTADLRQIVNGLLHKDYKKYDLQLKQIKDTEKREKYKLYGELLTAYGYQVEPKATSMKAVDYNTGKEITIPLDPTLSAIENGKKYFERYSKLKRTGEALKEIIRQTKDEIDHLESISASLDIIQDQADIAELKKEMEESGYIKARYVSSKGQKPGKKAPKEKNLKSAPLHFISSDGFDIYVGKNNFQNDYLSFKLAEGNDWWFHAKKLPGSHVIVKTAGKEIPDSTFEEAARLAAHFSKADGVSAKGTDGKVEIDYVQKKHLKKTPGGKPGFVIYHTNYSMAAGTDISQIKEV